jgi:hypothetical protein
MHHTPGKNELGQIGDQELIALINKVRAEYDLAPLEIDESLMRLAREHSEEMANQTILSHEQPSGNLQARMNRVGYLFEAARENIANTRSLYQAHSDFLKSETHRKNILANDVTHIGVGIARQPYPNDKYLTITEIFATPREKYQLSAIQDILVNQIKDLQNKGASSAIQDPLLDKLASHSLDSLQVPYNCEALKALLSASASEIKAARNPKLSRLEVVVQVLRNPKDISITAFNRRGESLMFGSAVRQITDIRNQPAFLVMALLSVSR